MQKENRLNNSVHIKTAKTQDKSIVMWSESNGISGSKAEYEARHTKLFVQK